MASDAAVIRLEGLGKSFTGREGVRVHAVDDVSLAVAAGEICCLTGPTGCGKSTILRLAAGLEAPDRGRVLVPTMEPGAGAAPPIGLLTQRHTLLPWLTTLENIALPLRIRGESAAAAHERCRPILETLGLAAAARTFPHELSGGM